ncbi:MAG: DHH family phosphoesterase [Bacilli bacterium]|jgi:single-stranded-DNA-specific exonuclease|nr:DHH family phosphoesterase [Bacilli bacterium]
MDLYSRLLAFYQLDAKSLSERQLQGDLSLIPSPLETFKGMKEALGLIRKHLESKDKIVIYGDYDVDGMTSTAILVKMFNKSGVNPGFFIPSRYHNGYGLNREMVEQFALKGYKLLLTIDNGISAYEGIKAAKEAGMDVLVIDHHALEDKLPEADLIIHPALSGGYVDYNISAACLAFLLDYAFYQKADPYQALEAGIAVFSDAMPLKGINLTLAEFSLAQLKEGKYPQFNFLLNGPKDFVSSKDISFSIVAPLNALGRVDIGIKNNDGVRFLLAQKQEDIEEYGRFILDNSLSKKRKASYLKETLFNDPREKDQPLIIIYNPEMEIGLAGAACSSLAEKEHKPVIVFSKVQGEEGKLVGSGRAPSGFDLFSLVSKFKDSYLAFGGHKEALGLTIKETDLESFKKKINEELKTHEVKVPNERALLINNDDFSFSSLKAIRMFEPFGTDFKEPLFAYWLSKERLAFSRDGKHLIVYLNQEAGVVAFNVDLTLFNSDGPFLLLGNLEEDNFNGRKKVRFNTSKVILDPSKVDLF